MQQERKWAKSEELLCTILEQMEEVSVMLMLDYWWESDALAQASQDN